MPRKPRVEAEDGYWHLTSRGALQAKIFHDALDFETLLGTLAEVAARVGWVVHTYCLMTNHYHLMVETPRGGLSTGMQLLNGRYAYRVNRRHRRSGHVFDARFSAKMVEDEGHALEAIRYVVLNPVRANICDDPSEWPWSSYRATAGLDPTPTFLHTNWTLEHFAPTPDVARARYRDFIAEGTEAASLAGLLALTPTKRDMTPQPTGA
jgi:REP element-mobilizing transposase RayT